MRIRVAVPEEHANPDVIDAVLEGVTRLDEHMIRAGQSPTSHELIQAGAIWRPENMGDEHFDHGGTIATRGWGDCDDWAPLHAATLRASGADPGAKAEVIPSGPSTYHAIVRRSDGSIDDPSIAAGMKPLKNVSGGPGIEILACDPHDGRPYQGTLLPAVGPLSLHCGIGVAVRGCHVVGEGMLYEGRCDLPIIGSPLVHVHSYWRRPGHHRHRRRVHGALPYAFSVTSQGATPQQALSRALVGAILCGDAVEVPPNLDKYKLLAVQAALAGASPGEVREALVQQMTGDVAAHAQATGTDPRQHTADMAAQLAAETGVQGYVVGDIFSDIGHIASGVVSSVANVVQSVSSTVGPWVGDILHGAEAAVSVIPGIGTAVSDVLATAESAYDTIAATLSGNPLLGAIDAAYNYALSTVPGGATLHFVLDPVKTALEDLVVKKEPVDSAMLDAILSDVPDVPKVGPISPRSVAASLAHLVVDHLGVKNTGRAKPGQHPVAIPKLAVQAAVPKPAPKPVAIRLAPKPAPKPPPKPIPLHLAPTAAPALAKLAPKPLGVPHAAVHTSLAPALAAQARQLPKPGSPGAPPGATHWVSKRMPDGTWYGRWV